MRPASLMIDGPWVTGKLPRRSMSTGRIGDLGAIAEQLREQLKIWVSPHPAHAPKTEQRLKKLNAAHLVKIDAGPIMTGQSLEKKQYWRVGLDQRLLFGKVIALTSGSRGLIGGTLPRKDRSR